MARRPARASGPIRTPLAIVAWVVLALWSAASVAVAAGPPFEDRPAGAGSQLVDDADVLPSRPQTALDASLRSLRDATGVDLVVYLQVKNAARTPDVVAADAVALLEQWQVGGADGDGAVLMIDFNRRATSAIAAIAAGEALLARVPQAALDTLVEDTMSQSLANADWLGAVTQGIVGLSTRVGSGSPVATPEPGATPAPTPAPGPDGTPDPGSTPEPTGAPGVPPDIGPAPPAGPPWPEPIDGVRVYDFAGVLEDAVIVDVGRTIAGIEDRTGAQVVVYTQVKPESDTTEEALADARSLMDAWGVGRRGIDDGLVILFDLDESRCRGQVQLFAGAGYRASYLTDDDRQAVFEQQMLPNLRDGLCDFDSALLAAMERIDAIATPERARSLELARQVDAATGLVLAPLIALGLLAWAGWSWLRYGKDPELVDSPAMLMPAPPPGLSAAAAAVVVDGRAKRHALTTALVDLAARGELRFRQPSEEDDGSVGIDVLVPDESDPLLARNRRMPLGEAETWVLERLQGVADAQGHIDRAALLDFAKHEDGFQDRLERHVTEQGWFREPPERSTDRWSFRGAVVLVLAAVTAFGGVILPSAGLLLVGVALLVGGIGMLILARAMPQRTMQGATVHAWLAAYRRTLEKTLEQSRSMDQVIASRAVPWLETPDQAVVWGIALGLHEEVEDVLARSVELARTPAAVSGGVWFPGWYVVGGTAAGGVATGAGGGPSGVFSSTVLPDFGAMTAVLSTIGTPASSSSSGGSSGGFGGGGSSGGGGAGGGF